MGRAAVLRAFEDINAALAVLAAEVEGAGSEPFSGADPLAGLADGCLDILAGARVVEAELAGLKARAAVAYADTAHAVAGPDAPVQAVEMAIAAEIGSLLVLGSRVAGAFLAASHALVKELPLTLSALGSGAISWSHALVMVEETVSLDRAGAAALEAQFLAPEVPRPAGAAAVGEMPAYRFKVKARTWRERHHAESIEKRHARGVADRRVEYRPEEDGMAWLSACLPADQALAGWNRLTAAARALQGPDETRTLTQRRADLYAGWLLGSTDVEHAHARTTGAGTTSAGAASPGTSSVGPSSAGASSAGAISPGTTRPGTSSSGAGSAGTSLSGTGAATRAVTGGATGPGNDAGPSSSIRAQVLVTVPVFSLLGLTDEPAVLDGYGPIPPSMARDLVANGAGSFYRVLVDPRDGAPLEIGRTNYRISKAMRNWLRLRDGKCPFPGCSNNSLDNEADHILAWHHGGTTGVSNLGQPCPKHHRLRHTSGWTPTPASKTGPPGWTSPTGRHYKSEHQGWEPPLWPDSAVPTDIRELENLLELWSTPDTPAELWSTPDTPAELWSTPDTPAERRPEDPSRQDPYPEEDVPEDTAPTGSCPDTAHTKIQCQKTCAGKRPAKPTPAAHSGAARRGGRAAGINCAVGSCLSVRAD